MHYTGAPGPAFGYKVGPDGQGTYRYMVEGLLSADRYHNAESARHDARRPQIVTVDGFLVPDIREG
jgi:hypothetical protein